MYLTTYLNTKCKIMNVNDYTNLMQNSITEEVQFYKITLEISNPKSLEQLSAKSRTHIGNIVHSLNKIMGILKPFEENYEQQYREFHIPKRSGGFRTIDAPNDNFKYALSQVKDIFEREIKCLPHTAAYAYVKQTSVKNAMEEHQKNDSKWYLKIDLHNFFPSCSPSLIHKQLLKLYPFHYLPGHMKNLLKKIIRICCLRNGLPQGTPMSPLLTNLLMVPYDYAINNLLKRGLGDHFVYTRYADDMIISSKSKFDYQEIVQKLKEILQPFEINEEKTRFGSTAGSNWNLGLMTNKDNKITLGYRKKKLFNAMLNNFLKDFSENRPWNKEDTYILQGQLGYLKHIEPDYYEYIINKYNNKYNLIYTQVIKQILN